MAKKSQEFYQKGKRFFSDVGGIVLGFVIAASTTLMSIIDWTSIDAGNPLKNLTPTQYIFISITIVIKGIANMFVFRTFLKNGLNVGKRHEEYQHHLDYHDEQITKGLPYKNEIDVLCEEDNFKEYKKEIARYCNHHRLIFDEVINEDLSLNLDYVPKNKKEKKALRRFYKDCIINEISTELLFDANVGGWVKNKKIILEKDYILQNSSTLMGVLFSALTSFLSIAPFTFSVSGIIMAFVNFGIIVGLAYYKQMGAITFSMEELGGEIRRRGLKLEMFVHIIESRPIEIPEINLETTNAKEGELNAET